MKYLASLIALIPLASGAAMVGRMVPTPGDCPPKPDTISELDAAAYLGEWYTFATLPGYFQPEGISCQKETYGLLPDGNVSSYIVQTLASGEQGDVCGYATIPDPSAPGDLVVYALSGAPAPLGLGWPYWILDTDYESYSSVYSCATFVEGSGLKYEYAWLFTRDPVPSDEAIALGQAAFDAQGLVIDWDILAQGEGCNYDLTPNCGEDFPSS